MPTTPTKTIIGQNVRRLRKLKGMTQVQLAESMGVHQTRIAEIESGRCDTSSATIDRLSDALGESPVTLVAAVEIPAEMSA